MTFDSQLQQWYATGSAQMPAEKVQVGEVKFVNSIED